MIDIVKKVLYAGVGVFALSEEKAKEIISELVKQGEITAREGENIASELKDKAVNKGRDIEDLMLKKVKDYLKIHSLEERVTKLEKEIEELKNK